MTIEIILPRLVSALLLGVVIGAERQFRQRMAGLRTNTLVSVGAALFVMLPEMYPEEMSPTRVAAQVVSGIGFLGAGVIFKEGLSVRGLNTAATLWCSAAVGVLCGAGFYLPALLGAGAVLAANMALRPIADRINAQPESTGTETETRYRISVTCREEDEADLRRMVLSALQEKGVQVFRLGSEDGPKPGAAIVHADACVQGRNEAAMESVLAYIGLEPGVSAIDWRTLVGDE